MGKSERSYKLGGTYSADSLYSSFQQVQGILHFLACQNISLKYHFHIFKDLLEVFLIDIQIKYKMIYIKYASGKKTALKAEVRGNFPF